MKKTLKKTIATLLTVTAILTAPAVQAVDYGAELKNQPTTTYSQTFTDVSPNYWAFSYIGEMNVRGVLSGYPNGYFYPDNYVTRAEFAKIMTVASSLPLDYNGYNAYADVNQNDWFYPYVLTAQYYLCGYNMNGGTYYLPNTNALREDIAVALVKLKGYDTTGYDESILKAMFTDYQSISEYARPYVATALEKGLISGYEDNTFRGQNSITRAEAATLLWRAYQYGSGNKVTASMTPYVPETTVTPTQVPTPEPTAKPVEKPTVVEETPVPTVKPTEAPTPEPTEEPTPEPTETPIQKTWKIETIGKADEYNKFDITYDNMLVEFSDTTVIKHDTDGAVLASLDMSEWTYDNMPECLVEPMDLPKTVREVVTFYIANERVYVDKDNIAWIDVVADMHGHYDDYSLLNSNHLLYSFELDKVSSPDELDLTSYVRSSLNKSKGRNGYRRGSDAYYHLQKYNLNTCEWDDIETDYMKPTDISWVNEGVIYRRGADKNLYIMDYNGDSELLVDVNDIEILDGRDMSGEIIGSTDISKGIYCVQGNTLRLITRN